MLPRVCVGILARDAEGVLPAFLQCMDAIEYPASRLCFAVRTNNNTDRTEQILAAWVKRKARRCSAIDLNSEDTPEQVQDGKPKEWTPLRLHTLGRLRNENMAMAEAFKCDAYFCCDVDNFIQPDTLRELVRTRLPIVAPFIKSDRDPGSDGAGYANFHAAVDHNGYYLDCPEYHAIFAQRVRGLIEVPVVHCCYLVRSAVIPLLTYNDESWRYEYVIFSDSARRAGVPQYLDNRRVYGRLTFGKDPAKALAMMREDAP